MGPALTFTGSIFLSVIFGKFLQANETKTVIIILIFAVERLLFSLMFTHFESGYFFAAFLNELFFTLFNVILKDCLLTFPGGEFHFRRCLVRISKPVLKFLRGEWIHLWKLSLRQIWKLLLCSGD